MYAFMIQHILKGISAPTADCRPPALRMIGSVKTLGDLTHPAVSGFYIASYGKAVNILKGLYALLFLLKSDKNRREPHSFPPVYLLFVPDFENAGRKVEV